MDLKLRKYNRLVDCTCMLVMKAWSMLCGHLSRIGLTTNVEWMHQPLLWNDTLKSTEGKMLRQSKDMSWARLYYAGIHSMLDWIRFSANNCDKL